MLSDVYIPNGFQKTSYRHRQKFKCMNNETKNYRRQTMNPKQTRNDYIYLCRNCSFLKTRPQETNAGKLIKLHSPNLVANRMSYQPANLDPSFWKIKNEEEKYDSKILTACARIHTFLQWQSKRQYPKFLAEAGFYYRGKNSIVHCFECGLETDVEEWLHGENPNQAHARLKRNCQFVIDNNFKPKPTTVIVNQLTMSPENNSTELKNSPILKQSRDKKETEADGSSMQNHLIMTDSHITPGIHEINTTDAMNSQATESVNVIDIKYKEYEDLQSRMQTFISWKFESKQKAKHLAEAGYFYTGENDIVRCFCCDLGLAEWDPKDDPWTEHARHSPTCGYLMHVRGNGFVHDIQKDWKRIYNPKHAAFDDKESRINTFDGWREDISQTPDILAEAGFFFTGEEDIVRCHYCDGGLRNWEPEDDPWEEHTRWFPFCKYVIKMKGREYIEEIKRQTMRRQEEEVSASRDNESREISFTSVRDQLQELCIAKDEINYAIDQFSKQNEIKELTVEWAMTVIYDNDRKKNSPFSVENTKAEQPCEKDPQKLLETNKKLKEQLKCMRCKTNNTCMLFIDCGHRVTCETCADKMDFCLYCNKKVKKRMKTFLS